jgi:LAGLIDADG endonuclease
MLCSMFEKFTLAYAAGYIDGDGCFSIRKQSIKSRHKFSATFLVISTSKETMEWFKKIFGGNILQKGSRQGHKPCYHFCVTGRKSAFIRELIPYLVEKKEEALLYRAFCSTDDFLAREAYIYDMHKQKHENNFVFPEFKKSFESIRNTITPSIEDFAYLAGFIDAECCLGITRYRSQNRENFLYKILLQCNNTKAPVFKWLLERFGGQIHFIDRSRYVNNRHQLTWRVCSSSLATILDNILPFLKQKRPVCEELIKFYKTTIPLKKTISRNSPDFRDFYLPILQEREEIFHKVQFLNKKGI